MKKAKITELLETLRSGEYTHPKGALDPMLEMSVNELKGANMPPKVNKAKMSPNLVLALTGFRQVKNTERLLERRNADLKAYVHSLDEADLAEYVRQTDENA